MYTTSVEVLRLSCNILVDIIPENVKFSRLRVLKFDQVTFLSYESVVKLLLNCPVLEDLSIRGCKWLTGDCSSICGSALKNLSLFSDEEFLPEILIETPGLENLQISSFAANILIMENLTFLTTALININVPSSVNGDYVFRLLKKINYVKILTLRDRTVEALNRAYHDEFEKVHHGFPPYHNFTEFDLNVEVYCEKTLLDDFLENSPNLESLIFPVGLVSTSSDES